MKSSNYSFSHHHKAGKASGKRRKELAERKSAAVYHYEKFLRLEGIGTRDMVSIISSDYIFYSTRHISRILGYSDSYKKTLIYNHPCLL